MVEYSLFNSADNCLTGILEYNVFDESLMLNVLFQERLLLHEAYFFSSTLLAEHVKRARKGAPSLFELAARRGIVTPAFRDKRTESLDQAYDVMKSAYGSSYEFLSPAMQPFRDRVTASVNMGLEAAKPFYWPTDRGSLGEGYEKVIRGLLQTEKPPGYSSLNPDREQLVRRVWEASKRWRYEYVEESIRRTHQKGAGPGLQRTELFCVLGWSVGIPRNIVTITPKDIIDRCADAEQRLAMEIFLKWVTQCHHLNQAQHFSVAINFPVYNIDQDFIVDTILRSPLDPPPDVTEGFRCQVELPPLDVLATADATELVAIRADLGAGYLFALRRWQRDPSPDNQEAVKASLRDYCDQICARYSSGIRQALVAEVFQQSSSPWRQVIKTAGSVTGLVTPAPVGVFSQLTTTISTLYRYRKMRRLDARLAPGKREVEVTLTSSGLTSFSQTADP